MENSDNKKNKWFKGRVKFWTVSITVAMLTLALFVLYQILIGESINKFSWNRAFASAGMVVIGYSYILSGITYYWDFLDKTLVYRKHLGLVGFYMIVIHFLLSLVVFPFMNYFRESSIMAFMFGFNSLAILVMMALISNKYSVAHIGGKMWRVLLRLGYVSYVFAVIHFWLRNSFKWSSWLDGTWRSDFPPTSLIVFLFAAYVIFVRVMLEISLRLKHRQKSTNKQSSS